jgi:putative transposase
VLSGPRSFGIHRRALTLQVRDGGRIVQVSVVVTTGVNDEGKRDMFGIDVGTSEDGTRWPRLPARLLVRGRSGAN